MPEAETEAQPRVVIRLRSRASRTRARTEELVEVDAPRTKEGQINQLIAVVETRFPGATLRVFDDGAGSFTKDDLHVVAAYQGDSGVGVAKNPTSGLIDKEDDGYEQLPLTA